MGRTIDETGKIYGYLTVLERAGSKDNRAMWLCQCKCGKQVEVAGKLLRNGHTQSCGCTNSKGEEKIIKILSKNEIIFQTQKTFSTCRFEDTQALAKFDFYIDNKYLIEYDGVQHFKCDSNYGWNVKEDFEKRKEKDSYKNQWCKENNIPLIRIPYTKLETLVLEDLLLETTKYRVV